MKFKKLVLLLIILNSCNLQEPKVFEIDVKNFSDNKFVLSDIADQIEYVPLDNTFPIGIVYSARINSNKIVLSIKDIGIVQFDKHGKFIRKIAQKGDGPGEFRYGMDFAINDQNGQVFVVDYNKINIYSQRGSFIKDISYEKYIAGTADGIEIFNSHIFIPDYLMYQDAKVNWILLDTMGNLISKKESLAHPLNSNHVSPGKTYKFEDKLFYFNYLNDTIFSITSDLKYHKAYLFAPSEYRWPKEGLNLHSLSQLYDIFKPGQMFETKKYIFLEYGFQDKHAILLKNKETKKTYQSYLDDPKSKTTVKSKAGIINDIDGGLPMTTSPIFYYFENNSEYLATLLLPYELKKYVASTTFKNTTPLYPQKKKELEQLATSLSENDNPVVMLVKLKE